MDHEEFDPHNPDTVGESTSGQGEACDRGRKMGQKPQGDEGGRGASGGPSESANADLPSGDKLPRSHKALADVKSNWAAQVRKISEELDRWERELAEGSEILERELAPAARRVRRLIRLLKIRGK